MKRVARRFQQSSEAGRSRGSAAGSLFKSGRPIALCCFLAVVFVTGGSASADVTSLLVLRPLAVLALGFGLSTLTYERVREYWQPLIIVLALMLLGLLQLVPLPPSVWHALPGRQTIAQIDGLLGMSDLWRPLSMDPQGTLNAVFSLVVPLAALVLAVQLGRPGQRQVLAFLLAIGALSGALAVLQLLGNPYGPWYLYEVTNNGFAVGLFANRNHEALFLDALLPLIFVWVQDVRGTWRDVSSPRGRRWIVALSAVLILVPLILVTGSRAGFAGLLIAAALTGALAFAEEAAGRRDRDRLPLAGKVAFMLVAGVIFFGLIALTIGLGRGLAFDRLMESDVSGDIRSFLTPAVSAIALHTFPWGTGLGSFEQVYRMYESDAHLMPRYVNHAHNDFIEIAMTGGIVGIAIVLFAVAWIALACFRLVQGLRTRRQVDLPAAAAVIAILIMTAGSAADYPLRTPSLACFLSVLAILVQQPLIRTSRTASESAITPADSRAPEALS